MVKKMNNREMIKLNERMNKDYKIVYNELTNKINILSKIKI